MNERLIFFAQTVSNQVDEGTNIVLNSVFFLIDLVGCDLFGGAFNLLYRRSWSHASSVEHSDESKFNLQKVASEGVLGEVFGNIGIPVPIVGGGDAVVDITSKKARKSDHPFVLVTCEISKLAY